MEYVIGRGNFALTVFVPYDCTNNCSFCTTKCMYKNIMSPDEAEPVITKYLEYANKSNIIQDIVFTGGEPMMDIEMLGRFIKLLPNKNVYINTNLLKENFFDFVKLVNKSSNVKGVNVSRHHANAQHEPTNQVEDWCFEAFEKPTRVNVFLPDNEDITKTTEFVEKVLERWQGTNVQVNFRADYTKMTPEELHSFNSKVASMFINNYEFVEHSCCDVCDTMKFNDPAHFQKFTYHRGLEKSSINLRTKTIVNDAILMPHEHNGKPTYGLFYDWNKKEDPSFENMIFVGSGKRKKQNTTTTTKSKTPVKEQTPSKVTYREPVASCGSFYGYGSCG